MVRENKAEVTIKIFQVGNSVKFTGVDVETRTKLSIIGTPSSGEDIRKKTVVNKLNYVLCNGMGSVGGTGIVI